jgi:IS4 transposase
MSVEDLEEYDRVVFNIENPQLKRYLVLNETLRPEHNFRIMRTLQEYVLKRKADYEGNIPKPGQSAF